MARRAGVLPGREQAESEIVCEWRIYDLSGDAGLTEQSDQSCIPGRSSGSTSVLATHSKVDLQEQHAH